MCPARFIRVDGLEIDMNPMLGEFTNWSKLRNYFVNKRKCKHVVTDLDESMLTREVKLVPCAPNKEHADFSRVLLHERKLDFIESNDVLKGFSEDLESHLDKFKMLVRTVIIFFEEWGKAD